MSKGWGGAAGQPSAVGASAGWGLGEGLNAHLLGDDDQRVLVLRQKVEDAPYLEGVVIWDDQPAQVQVLPGAQRPAHLVEVLTIKVIGHLRQKRLFLQAADVTNKIIWVFLGCCCFLFYLIAAMTKTTSKTLEFQSLRWRALFKSWNWSSSGEALNSSVSIETSVMATAQSCGLEALVWTRSGTPPLASVPASSHWWTLISSPQTFWCSRTAKYRKFSQAASTVAQRSKSQT